MGGVESLWVLLDAHREFFKCVRTAEIVDDFELTSIPTSSGHTVSYYGDGRILMVFGVGAPGVPIEYATLSLHSLVWHQLLVARNHLLGSTRFLA